MLFLFTSEAREARSIDFLRETQERLTPNVIDFITALHAANERLFLRKSQRFFLKLTNDF